MWNAKELQISKLIEAQDLVLPRFQRKSTWNERKDFLLALSFFKGLPLGTIVIKDEGLAGDSSVRYLLDGRQRWEALKGIRDPETVYRWAKASIGIRPNWSDVTVTAEFLRAIDDYFGSDPSDDSLPDGTDDSDEGDEAEAVLASEDSAAYGDDEQSVTGASGLDELLQIILLVHPMTSKGSRFTKAFAFHDLIDALPFVDINDAGAQRINSAKLREWITFRRKISNVQGSSTLTPDDFVGWLTNGKVFEPAIDAAIRDRTTKNWGTIVAAIRLNASMETRLEQTVIAALVLSGTSASDDAKIFEIINTGGTKLTAAEVLSAASQWRAPVANPSVRLLADAADLYSTMGVQAAEGAVRWDVPATLLSRLEAPSILGPLTGPTPRNDTRKFERRITLGFQLMAGWYAGKIAKDFVESLPKAKVDIDWGSTSFEDTINSAIRYACKQEQFQYWDAWGLSVIGLMSDAVALNFTLLTALDWVRKGRPTTDGAEMKALRRNARTLLDRSIYEYCVGQWRGSSDSKIAGNIASIKTNADSAFEPVPGDDWVRLITEVVESGTILGVDYTERLDPRIKLLLCYRHVINRRWLEPSPGMSVEFDHIIPSSEFPGIPAGDPKKRMEHHIVNVAPLPGPLNRVKSDQSLKKIASAADRQQISALEDVPLDRFDAMSSGIAVLELAAERGPKLIADLTGKRALRLEVANEQT